MQIEFVHDGLSDEEKYQIRQGLSLIQNFDKVVILPFPLQANIAPSGNPILLHLFFNHNDRDVRLKCATSLEIFDDPDAFEFFVIKGIQSQRDEFLMEQG